jgi:hypothetical protein
VEKQELGRKRYKTFQREARILNHRFLCMVSRVTGYVILLYNPLRIKSFCMSTEEVSPWVTTCLEVVISDHREHGILS